MASFYLCLICLSIFFRGVTGQVTDIRLADGKNSQSGRVEVLVNNVWGTVCEDTWDGNDAVVVCRGLGLGGGSALTRASFGRGPVDFPINLIQVQCRGTENTLNACLTTTQGTCQNGPGAAVRCTANSVGTPATQICTTPASNVRLAHNKTGVPNGIGVVEVQHPVSRTWGSVCSNWFDVNAAKVICRMLCFDPIYARPVILPKTTFETRLNVMLTNVSCPTGREGDFFRDCQHSTWGPSGCNQAEAVTITCQKYNPCYPNDCYKAPPTPIVTCNDTYIEVKFSLLQQPLLKTFQLSVYPPNTCNVYTGNTTVPSSEQFVFILIEITTCPAVDVTYNNTHFLYHVKVDEAHSQSEVIITDKTYMVDVYCALPRNYNVTIPFEIVTEAITASGIGRFFVLMRFWHSDHFITPYTTLVKIPVGDCLNVSVDLVVNNPRLMIAVSSCWVTPNPPPIPYMYRDLFIDRRVIDPTVIIYPLTALRLGFQYRVFQFVEYQQVTVHCTAVVCDRFDTSIDCSRHYRNRRSTGYRVIQVDSEPIYIINSNKNQNEITKLSPTAVPNVVKTQTSLRKLTERNLEITKFKSTGKHTVVTSTKSRSPATTPETILKTSTPVATTTSTVTHKASTPVTTTKSSTTLKTPTTVPTTKSSTTIKTSTPTSSTSTKTTTPGPSTTTSVVKTPATKGSPSPQTHKGVLDTENSSGLHERHSDMKTMETSPQKNVLPTSQTTSSSTASLPTSKLLRTSTEFSTAPSADKETGMVLDMSVSINTWRDVSLTLPLQTGIPILPGTLANISVDIYDEENLYTIYVPRCWVAPVGNEKLYLELFRDNVVTEKTLTILKMDNTSLGFCFKTPRFNGYHSICIHCEVLVCNHKQCLTLHHIRSQHLPTEEVSDTDEQLMPRGRPIAVGSTSATSTSMAEAFIVMFLPVIAAIFSCN